MDVEAVGQVERDGMLVEQVFDVAVDIRRGSPTFARWVGVRLSGETFRQVYVPPGFAHGFLALSEGAELHYKVTDYYAPGHERSLRWDDPDLRIGWPAGIRPLLSAKDQGLPLLRDIPPEKLPVY